MDAAMLVKRESSEQAIYLAGQTSPVNGAISGGLAHGA
jgi:hypothetical protein